VTDTSYLRHTEFLGFRNRVQWGKN